MAMEVLVAGATLVRTGTGSSDALESLGYTINGVQKESNAFFADVHGDENGGNEGPPIEIQNFGQIDVLRMEFSRFDKAVWAKVVPFLKGGTAGAVGTVGELVFSGSKFFRVLLTATNFTRNYLRCIPRQPQRINVGSKFSTLILEWECHKNGSGVLWDTTTS